MLGKRVSKYFSHLSFYKCMYNFNAKKPLFDLLWLIV